MIPSNPAERPFVSGVCITIWTGWFCALTITWHVFVMVMPLWGDLFLQVLLQKGIVNGGDDR